MRASPDNISELYRNEVFVFGSNLEGRHGKGAAKQAKQWGAVYGKGEGHYGKTYAIPTKGIGQPLPILKLDEIKVHVDRFLDYARHRNDLYFLVTKIGCGEAGYSSAAVWDRCQQTHLLNGQRSSWRSFNWSIQYLGDV